MSRPAAFLSCLALLTAGPAAFGQYPGYGPPAFGPPPVGVGGPMLGPPRFAPPPGFAPSAGWGPPAFRPSPRGVPREPGPSQAELARPDRFGPAVRLEPTAKEVSVGRVRARRYDYSFESRPLAGPGWNAAPPGDAW